MKISEQQLKNQFNFSIALRFEIFYALQIVTDKNSRIHSVWKQNAIKLLPRSFFSKEEPITRAFNVWPILLDTLQGCSLDLTFDEIILNLENMDLALFQRRFLLSCLHCEKTVDEILNGLCLSKGLQKIQKQKQEWLAFIGLYPYKSSAPLIQVIEMLLEHPDRCCFKIIEVLKIFWESVFKNTWLEIIPQLKASLSEKERLFEASTLDEFSKAALLRIEFNNSKQNISAIRGGAKTPYLSVGKSYIIPSMFNDKRYWTAFNSEMKAHLYIAYFDPAIGLEKTAKISKVSYDEPELDPALIYKALGDSTRYAIVKLISGTTKTSIELSKILGVSKPTISHHLRVLRDAGLVTEKHQSGSIELLLKREVIENLSSITINHLYTK